MQRIFACSRVAFFGAACAACFLMASVADAQSQLLDPGWQLVYPGQPSQPTYGGGGGASAGGVIRYMFGDGVGQYAIQRPYQPAPVYYQQVPAPQPRGYQPAPVYYQQVPAPQPRGYQPAPVYYQQVPAPQPRGYQPAPVYYQQVPAAQPRGFQSAPVYYQQVPAQQPSSFQSAPVSYQPVPAQQPRGFQSAPVYYQQAPAPQPRGFQTPPAAYQQIPAQQPMTFQSAPAAYQQAPAQQQSTFQSSWHTNYPQAPAPQPAAYQPGPVSYQQVPPQQQDTDPPPLPPVPALQQRVARNDPGAGYAPSGFGDMAHPIVDPKYDRQVVDYHTDEQPGTIVIDTPHYFLYLVLEGSKALRYGIGVGRPGFTWAGMKEITAMREWPEWRPPDDMLKRRPDLPRFVAGGADNPLGARALYLGSTLYRIHGSNEPWTIGTQVSSGCIRLRNEDIVDLYGRVKIGTKVIVI